MNNKEDLSRRNFLSKVGAGFASAGIAGAAGGSVLSTFSNKKKHKEEILYRTLGKTGFKVPVIGMGIMNTNNPEVVARSYEIGVRLFDTALRYYNEGMVGDIVQKLGIRDKIVLETKVPVPDYLNPGSMESDEMKQRFLSDFDGCLSRLKTDYVDILFLHNIKFIRDVTNPGLLEALNEIKESKRARFIGVSTHTLQEDVLNEAVNHSELYSVVQIALNFVMSTSPRYADRFDAIMKAVKNASSNNLGIIAMKTQALGNRDIPVGSAHHTAALKWALLQDGVTCAIPGYTNFAEMEQDFSVVYDLEYTDEEKEYLEDNKVEYSAQFCLQCRECLPTCPKGVDIPTLMRTHMYASGYANFRQARLALEEIPVEKGIKTCISCTNCIARCANAVSIKTKINELKLIYA